LPSLTARRPKVDSAMSDRRQNSLISARIWSFFMEIGLGRRWAARLGLPVLAPPAHPRKGSRAIWSRSHLPLYNAENRYFGARMFRSYCVAALTFLAASLGTARAGYLDENPDEVFEDVYARIGALPVQAARDSFVWVRLQELKREPCDQKSINDLALMLDKLGYRRQAAEGLYQFVVNCGAAVTALHRSVDIYLKLSDYPKAVEVADEFIRRAPSNHDAHYLRGVALEGTGDHKRALADYSDAIELFGSDKKSISSRVFWRMAGAYAALKQFCEAASPINQWVALDPATRDTSRT